MDAEIHLFDNDKDLISFEAGEAIFRAGDPRDYMYVVVEGQVDLMVNEILVETVAGGGIFGEMALIEQEVRVASAIARTSCRLAAVNEQRFNFMVCQTPFFALTVMRVLARRLRRMDAQLRS